MKARGLASSEAVDERITALADDLQKLDAAARASLRSAGDTVFIATHPRYQYLARAYGLTILSLEWEAGAMPSEEELEELAILAKESGARVLIWEAEPPATGREAVAALGLEDVVFPTLASPPAAQNFLEVFDASIEAMAQAAKRSGSG